MKKWSSILSGAGAAILSVLSCAGCPGCLPLYVGILGLIGIELGDVHEFLFPIMILFSLLSLGLMVRQIRKHHGSWKPFILAASASVGMGAAAFCGYELLLYVCVALFMGGILWSKRAHVHGGHHGCC